MRCSSAPSAVSATPPGVRVNTSWPMSASSRATARLTAAWVTHSSCAARRKLPVRATARKECSSTRDGLWIRMVLVAARLPAYYMKSSAATEMSIVVHAPAS